MTAELIPAQTVPAPPDICAKPGLCPCEAPCYWALKALADIRRDGWPPVKPPRQPPG